jgi:NAD(P)-dependent dehydrogenase (short-subunit alcohol dehydrogenase family)
MRMLTRTAGAELGPHGVRAVNVGPGAPYLTSTTVFADGGIVQGSVGL